MGTVLSDTILSWFEKLESLFLRNATCLVYFLQIIFSSFPKICVFIYFALNIFYLSFKETSACNYRPHIPGAFSFCHENKWEIDLILILYCEWHGVYFLVFIECFPTVSLPSLTSTFCCDLKAYHMKNRVQLNNILLLNLKVTN